MNIIDARWSEVCAMLRKLARSDPEGYAHIMARSTGGARETLIEQLELAARIPLGDHVLPLPALDRARESC